MKNTVRCERISDNLIQYLFSYYRSSRCSKIKQISEIFSKKFTFISQLLNSVLLLVNDCNAFHDNKKYETDLC